jgi:Zn-finger nucleic acid-binding protein
MSRSHKANHYGTLVERKAADRYNLELDRCSWHDARCLDGTPVEIKAAMHRHSDGQPGTFKLYDRYHERLRYKGGKYVFGVYRVCGPGIQILNWMMCHSSNLPRIEWHGGGEHRDARQAKLRIESLF